MNDGFSRYDLRLFGRLSDREKEVFIELSKGKTNKEIAKTLFISVNTIKTQSKSIYSKLEVSNRTQAVKKVNNIEM